MSGQFTLYSYWRSSCSWRVRTALLYKGLQYEYRHVSLIGDKGTTKPDFVKVNPYRQIPALVIDDEGRQVTLFQSLAIIQFLDEAYPETPALLPQDPLTRAKVRIVADCISAGIQPLQNIPVLEKMNQIEGPGAGVKWAAQVISDRLADLEVILKDYAGKNCVGDQVTMADVCLVPQVYNAIRFGVDVSSFPLIMRIHDDLMKLPAFAEGHPSKQPDAVP